MLEDRNSLWFRVLTARYKVIGSRVCDGGRDASTWWRDISVLRSVGWFQSHVSLSLGDGKNTFFLDGHLGGRSIVTG